MRNWAITVVACLACFDASLSARRQGSGLVLGRVVDGATAETLSGVVVSMRGHDRQLTDAQGRFVFFDVAPGSYRILASKDGYAEGEPGRLWSGASEIGLVQGAQFPFATAQRFEIKPGERRADVVIKLWRYGAITGRVSDQTGRPVVGATVQAWPKALAAGRAWFNHVTPLFSQTDDRGVYRISWVLAGEYVVVVPAVSISVPASFPPPSKLSTTWPIDIATALKKFGQNTYEDFPLLGTPRASARGEWVQATLGVPDPGDRLVGFATTFSSGATSVSNATVYAVGPGEEVAGIDIIARVEPLHRVSGRILGTFGPPGAMTARLASTGTTGQDSADVSLAVADSEGQFSFVAVPSGNYRVRVLTLGNGGGSGGFLGPGMGSLTFFASSPLTDPPMGWADLPLTVGDNDVTGVLVALRPAVQLTGRIILDGQQAPSLPTSPRGPVTVMMTLDPADGRPTTVQPQYPFLFDANGRFRSVGVTPGRYFLQMTRVPEGWALKAAMLNGVDISVDGITVGADPPGEVTVTLTDKPPHVTGQIRDEHGNPDGSASVLIFPVDRRSWTDFGALPRMITAWRATESGRYDAVGLPAGDYFIVAAPDAVRARWPSVETFDVLSRVAERVRLDGTSRTLDLTTRIVK